MFEWRELRLVVPDDRYAAVLRAVAAVLTDPEAPPALPGRAWTVEDVTNCAEQIGDRERHIVLQVTDPGRINIAASALAERFGNGSSFDWRHEMPLLVELAKGLIDPFVERKVGDLDMLASVWDRELVQRFRETAERCMGLSHEEKRPT